MTIGDHGYGVRVGNETYSLVITEEDLEKRRIEKEKAKKLSQETNRRRKALEEKKKVAEERDARKRALELSKRRQRQTEATERYQRSHLAGKHDRKTKFSHGLKGVPSLDSVLHQLRSGSTEIIYNHKTDGASVTSKEQLNQGRQMFESELQEQQRQIIEQHKYQTLKDFQHELHNDVALAPSAQPNIDISDTDSLDGEAQHYQQRPSYTHHQSPYTHSTIDIMSGRANDAYYPSQQYLTEPHFNNLADTLSKLFVNKQAYNKGHYETPSFVKAKPINDVTTQLTIEDADDVINDDVIHNDVILDKNNIDNRDSNNSSGIQITKSNILEYGPSTRTHTNEEYETNVYEDNQHEVFDDQDSLHGSSSSGTSPAFGHMTEFQRKYFSDVEDQNRSKTNSYVHSASPAGQNFNDINAQENADSSNHYYSAQIATRSPPSYYVKSFRPWSATGSPHTVAAEAPKLTAQRPMSAVHRNPTEKIKKNEIPEEVKTEHVRVSSARTTATPISSMYNEAWGKPTVDSSTSRNVVLLARQAIQTSTPTTVTKTLVSSVLADSKPLPAPTQQQNVTFSPEIDVKEAEIVKESSTSDAKVVKGILRKVSKYEKRSRPNSSVYPTYHTAAALARQQWVDHMTNMPMTRPKSALRAKLNGVEVKDSFEVHKAEETTTKSVRWHEVQYNDGTSATIAESGQVVPNQTPVVAPEPPPPKPAPKNKSKPRSNTPPKAKTSPKGKKGVGKGGKGRKLKPAKEAPIPMEPHPPIAKKKQLTVTTTLNYSIPHPVAQSTSPITHGVTKPRHRVAWANNQDAVTMDTLKSSGNTESPECSRSSNGNYIIKNGNQVTIHMTSPEFSSPKQVSLENSPQLNKTPTDQEINWLWDKVRTCLAQRPATRGHNGVLRKSASDTSRNGSSSARRADWTGSPSGQQQANIVQIDGGLLARDNFITHQSRSRGRRLVRPSSAVVLSSRQPLKPNEMYSPFMRRQALLQQRRQKHYMSRGVKHEMMKSVATYPTPVQSPHLPLNSPSTTGGAMDHVSESTAAFFLAETLAEQNMSEDQILHAMDSLQRKTKEAQKLGRSVIPSTLSMEEQRLLASLEKLNTRLKEVEAAVVNNPNVTFLNQPNMHYTDSTIHDRPFMTSYKHHNHRSMSADMRHQRSRPRY